jgi:Cu/Ag efflux pump CusA
VVVGGTISAAALTLLVLPVTYYWAHRARAWVTARLKGMVPQNA